MVRVGAVRPLALAGGFDVDEGAGGRARDGDWRVRPLTARILVGRGFDRCRAGGALSAARASPICGRPRGWRTFRARSIGWPRASRAGETIGVFGDYDVDGVTTAAVLASALRAFGGKVIPRAASRARRLRPGPGGRRALRRRRLPVLVTGDCGTSDHEPWWLPARAGMDVIVIDHHEVPAGETASFALINPRRPDDGFAFKGLASCGVAFYLAAALRTRPSASSFDPRDLLDLVALGTIADLVPLVDENRVLVAAGLKTLSARRRPGLARARRAGGAGGLGDHRARRRLSVDPPPQRRRPLGEAQLALDLLLAGRRRRRAPRGRARGQ